MDRKYFYRPLSLLMAIVMIFSSSLVYAPSFATHFEGDDLPIEDFHMIESEDIYDEILGTFDGSTKVLMRDPEQYDEDIDLIKAYKRVKIWFWWVTLEYLKAAETFDSSESFSATEIFSTRYIPAREAPYEIIILGRELTTEDGLDWPENPDHLSWKEWLLLEFGPDWVPDDTDGYIVLGYGDLYIHTNDAPVAGDTTAEVDEDSGVNDINLSGFISDPNDHDVIITEVAVDVSSVVPFGSNVGSFTIAGQTVQYTPAPNYFGEFELDYTVQDVIDVNPLTDVGTVTITVNRVSNVMMVIMLGEDDEFIQQFDDSYDIRHDVLYIPSIAATVADKWEEVSLVYGAFDQEIDFFDNYGEFYVDFFGVDTVGSAGEDGRRHVVINAQPIISFEEIIPDVDRPLLSEVEPAVAYDDEVFFMDEEFSLLEYLYLYDFEEYPGNPTGHVTEVPEGMILRVYYLGEAYEVDDLFTLFGNLASDDPNMVLSLTFELEDSQGGISALSLPFILNVKNNPPELLIEDDFLIYEVGEEIDLFEGVTATDVETAVEDLVIEVDDPSFDTSVPGMYTLIYTVTDEADLTDVGSVDVWVLSVPEIMVEPAEITMDLGGHFPTFTGVKPTFWDFGLNEEGLGFRFISTYFRAYIMDGEEQVELENIFTPGAEHLGDLIIYYEAKKVVYEMSALANIQSEPIFVDEVVKTVERTLTVTDVDLEDYFYASDFYNMSPYQYGFVSGAEVEEEGFFEMMFSNLIKYNPYTDEIRYVTLIGVEQEEVVQPGGLFDTVRQFDDLALTYDKELYGVKGDTFYQYDGLGSFDMIYKLTVAEPAPVQIWGPRVYSLTAGPRDELVFILNGTEIHILHLDDLVLENGQYETMVYDLGDRYDKVTDITYNNDFTEIYGIGINYIVPQDTDVNEEFFGFEMPYESELFRILMDVEVDPAEVGEAHTLLDYAFDEEFTVELDPNFAYRGIVNIGEDLFLTKYQIRDIVEEPLQTSEFEMLFDGNITFVEQRDYDGELMGTDEIPDYPFNAATGAAATFEKTITVTPNPANLYVGYGKVAADGTDDLDATIFPELAFPEDVEVIWSIDSGNTYVTLDQNGVVTAIEGNIPSGGAAAVIKASADGEDGYATVYITRVPVPTPPPPTPPTPTPTTTPTIRVTLDTDAVTLDYGAGADPEFTSYDFTETVTGTTNRAVTWSLDDDTFATVDENGVVTTVGDIPVGQGDIVVTLTVRTVVGGATDTAEILFLEQNPLGAIEFFDPYISGYPDKSFKPKNYVTRAEAATMFARILKLNTSFTGTQKYDDVNPGYWAYNHIQAINRTGMFVGYGDGTFRPDAPITRAEIAQVFSNYWTFADMSVNGVNTSPIPDVKSNYWAYNAINRLYNTGIISGYADGTFKPDIPTLREQIVVMINKLINRPANLAPASMFTDVLDSHPNYGHIEAASQPYVKPLE